MQNKQEPMINIPPIGLNIDVSNLDEVIVKLERINDLSHDVTNLVPLDDYLLKVSEVAQILGVNAGAVNKIIKAGYLKVLKLGCTKIRKKELERFMLYAEETGLSLDQM